MDADEPRRKKKRKQRRRKRRSSRDDSSSSSSDSSAAVTSSGVQGTQGVLNSFLVKIPFHQFLSGLLLVRCQDQFVEHRCISL